MGLVLTVSVAKDTSVEAGATANTKTCGKRTGYRTLLRLRNISINTTRKTVLQLKSISHTSNFIIYRYMWSTW
jgi:hypothetical protein